MSRPEGSAPGKVMLAGEYAVLAGGCALAMAVDRRARAWVEPSHRRPHPNPTDGPSPGLSGEGRAEDSRTPWGDGLPPETSAALALALEHRLLRGPHTLHADATALCEGPHKLGLGSSAAVAVAALTAALAAEGTTARTLTAELRARIARTARAGHRRVQGGGSGVDVIASALGGVVRVGFPDGLDGEPSVSAVEIPTDLHWAVLWTGAPARTSDLLRTVRSFAARDAQAYQRRMHEIRDAEAALYAALQAADVPDALRALRAHQHAQHALGRDAGALVVTGPMATLAAAAEPLGAAVKPSGAGGGDIVLAAAQDRPTLDAVLSEGARLGFARLTLAVDRDGARVEQGEPSQ